MTFGAADGALTSNNDPTGTNTRPSTLYEALLQLKVRLALLCGRITRLVRTSVCLSVSYGLLTR